MSNIKLVHSGGNSVSLTTPDSNPAANRTFKLPGADGTSGQAMVTDGSGALSFASMPSSGPLLQYKYEGNNTGRTHNTSSWSDSGFGSVTITPTNATTINIISFTTKANVGSGGQTYYSIYFSTNGGGSYAQVPGLDSNNGMFRKLNNNTDYTVSFRYAHDHNTTSAIIYKIYMYSQSSTEINWDSGYGLLTVEEITS